MQAKGGGAIRVVTGHLSFDPTRPVTRTHRPDPRVKFDPRVKTDPRVKFDPRVGSAFNYGANMNCLLSITTTTTH